MHAGGPRAATSLCFRPRRRRARERSGGEGGRGQSLYLGPRMIGEGQSMVRDRVFGRRSILGWLALGGAAALTAACGGAAPASTPAPAAPSAPSNSPAPTSQPAATAAPAQPGKATLQYWSFFPSDNT